MAFYKQLSLTTTSIVTVAVLILAYFFQETINSITAFGAIDPLAYIRLYLSSTLSLVDYSAVPSDSTCISLAQQLPNIVHLPGDEQYPLEIGTYWSVQAQSFLPSCVVRPRSALEVSAIITHLKQLYDNSIVADVNSKHKVQFAVKAGGHFPEAGFSSIQGGVLMDLGKLDTIDVFPAQGAVRFGTGLRWHDVYFELEKHGLATIGGRDGHVGVGGLILGGGISFLSSQHGMVCDNILSYEIVLANGTIATVSEFEHADLWRALKGGSGNFGIVTSFTAKTFPSRKIWAGYVYWPIGRSEQTIRETHEFAKAENFDQYASTPILAFGHIRKMFGGRYGWIAAACHIGYTGERSKSEKSWPQVWQGFKSILRIWSTVQTHSLSSAGAELTGMAPSGQRQFQLTFTAKNDLDTLNHFYSIWSIYSDKLKHVRGLGHAMVYQPLSLGIMRKGTHNVLGLESRNASESLIIVLFTQAWKFESDDEFMQGATRQMVHEMQEYARAKRTLDPYIYLNYAGSGQDVFVSYGEDNLRFLKDVSRKYDPSSFWQRARQGGFKLDL